MVDVLSITIRHILPAVQPHCVDWSQSSRLSFVYGHERAVLFLLFDPVRWETALRECDSPTHHGRSLHLMDLSCRRTRNKCVQTSEWPRARLASCNADWIMLGKMTWFFTAQLVFLPFVDSCRSRATSVPNGRALEQMAQQRPKLAGHCSEKLPYTYADAENCRSLLAFTKLGSRPIWRPRRLQHPCPLPAQP